MMKMKSLLALKTEALGTGIDSGIQDKLSSEFATKSDTGSALRHYISNGVVEAHGGRI
jgi:hypothetical protein